MLKRKFRKLVNNPKLFFSDMAIKHSDKISYLKPKKMEGHYQYTVVSAVYNVGRYLEDYFNSLVKQRLDFKKHITLILVDDGSTDHSAEIIKRWQKKYPDNIHYIYKENGGQASARNLGMQYVKTEWVTFMDPDDFVDADYFLESDNFIHTHKNDNIRLLSCNFIFYYEDKDAYSNTHPLSYRFNDGDKVYPLLRMENNPQFHVNSAIFKKDDLINHGVTFAENIRPNFEDGHFVISYIAKVKDGVIGFSPKAKYFYRKRSDGSSSLDSAWEKKGRYLDVLENGYLDSLLTCKNDLPFIPKSVQWTIMYDLMWHFKRIVSHPEKLSCLSESERDRYYYLLTSIFKLIDTEQIMSFNLAGAWFYHKIGMLSLKRETEPYQIVYVEKFDRIKNQVQLRYFTTNLGLEVTYINDKEAYPIAAKTIKHDIAGHQFLLERRMWIQLEKNSILNVRINNLNTQISLSGKLHKNGVKSDLISQSTHKNIPYNKMKFNDSWLFMDRETQADDNAEHLYRYVRENHSERKIFFVLKNDSCDWNRLVNDGFNLLPFGSQQHIEALKNCSKVISSHADYYVTNYLGQHMLDGRHFCFLQHGITQNDISGWLNKKEQIDLFVTATSAEYNSIVSDTSRYKYTKKEVKLTGFPRHDALINNSKKTEKIILIMPTWREWVVGPQLSTSNEREINPDFDNTEYLISWKELLNSSDLKEMCEMSGYKVIFSPHSSIRPYLNSFSVPDYISIFTPGSESIQSLFTRSAIMITDYSSVSFEMAVQGKPTIYYQFDEEQMFSGAHTLARGYFDYRKHGFGPVVNDFKSLLSALSETLSNDGKPSNDIIERISEMFPQRDGNACRRVYDAICSLDEKSDKSIKMDDHAIGLDYAVRAFKHKAYAIAESRWKVLKSNTKNDEMVIIGLISSLRMQGKLEEANTNFNYYFKSDCTQWSERVLTEAAYLSMYQHKWDLAVTYWERITTKSTEQHLSYIQSLSELEWHQALAREIRHLDNLAIPSRFVTLAQAWRDMANKEWKSAINKIEANVNDYSKDELFSYKPQLMLSRCLRNIWDVTGAYKYLTSYEKHTKNDVLCRVEIAQLAFLQENWDKVIYQIQLAFKDLHDIPEPIALIYVRALESKISDVVIRKDVVFNKELTLTKVRALREQGYIGQASDFFNNSFSNIRVSAWCDSMKYEAARIAMAKHCWLDALSFWDSMECYDNISGMARLRCLAELGSHKAVRRTILDAEWVRTISKNQFSFAEALYYIAKSDWHSASKILETSLHGYEFHEFLIHKPQLLLSRCYRNMGLYKEAVKQLINYEKHTRNDPACRVEIALLAKEKNEWSKVVAQLEQAYPSPSDLPKELAVIMVLSLQNINAFKKMDTVLKSLPKSTFDFVSENMVVFVTKENVLS